MEIGQLEIDGLCSSLGAILGHLTAGGPRTLQAISVNVLAGGSAGFFLGPTMVDWWQIAPGRPAGGVCLATATLGALIIPTILKAVRPWTERNADNVVGRVAGRIVSALASPAPISPRVPDPPPETDR